MMTLLNYLLGFLLVLDCMLLTLLVLVQLPKKDAGVGMAFGGGAADALFGAGSGTALTRLTKWSAGIFFGLVILLSIVSGSGNASDQQLRRAMENTKMQQAPTPAPATAAPAAATTIPTSSAPSLNLTIGSNSTPAAPPATAAPATPAPPASATNGTPK